MPDSVSEMYDTDMIHNDTDMNIMDESGWWFLGDTTHKQ